MKKFTFLWCFLLGFSSLLSAQHLTTEEEYRLMNPQSTTILVQNELHDMEGLLQRLSNLGHQINGIEEFFNESEIQALRSHFAVQNRDAFGGPCDNAIEITSGNIVNQPLVCGPGDLLNSGNVSPFCIDDNTGAEIPSFYGGGVEATYTYTPGSSGPVTITVDNTTWVAIFVYDGCPASGGNCVAATRSTTATRTVNFNAVADTEYFIWIDSWPPPASPCTEGGQLTLSGPEPAGGGGGTGVPTAFGINNAAPSYGYFEISNPSVFTGLSAGSGTANFEGAGAIDPNDNDTAYVIDNVGAMWSVDVQTGVYTALGNVGVNDMTGLEFNPVDGNLYGTTTTSFYSIDIGAVSATLIGSLNLPGGALAIALAIDGDGNAYTYDIVDDLFYSINTTTGAATVIGPIGFDANFGQGMSWDAETDQVYMAAFNNTIFDSELRLVNTATGGTTSLGTIIPGTLSQIGWVSIINSGTGGGGGTGNLWVVNVQDTGFGDEVTWELRDNLGTVILSGGPYGLGYNDTQSVNTENEPLEFYIEAMGAFNDNTPTYTVSCGGEVIVTGSLSGGDDVTHSGLECAGGGPTNNWECADAIALTCGDVVTGTTVGATNSGGNASPDVFYSYTGSGEVEIVTISLCDGGTTYDSFLRVFESCDNLSLGNELVLNDDFCGLQSQLSFESDGTTTYIIMVEGFGTASGAYSLAITCELPPPPPACGGIFTDSGGPDGNYSNNEDITWTISPDDPDDFVTVIFTAFDVEATWDALYVFDGPDTSSPLISSGNPPTNSGFPAGGWYGTTIPGPFASTHPSGALTFRFLSDGSVTRPGWIADVVCLPVPPPNDLIENAISVTNETQPYTDPAVRLQYATNELLNPDGCAIAGTNGVWYSFTASMDGTAQASITTPAGTSAVIFYEAPSEDVGDETDLTYNFEVTNQCAPGTAASITTTAGQSYYIFVLNTGGPSDVVIDISDSLGTNDNTIDGFVMYPNPASNVLNLSSNISIDDVTVYNMLGQRVYAQTIGATRTQIDVSGLSTGTYLIKVNAEGQTATYHFVKK